MLDLYTVELPCLSSCKRDGLFFFLLVSLDSSPSYLNIFLPDARLAMLSVPIMTRDSVGVHSGVAPLGGVTVVHQPAYGSTGQGGDGHHCADDGERRNDLPPHFYLKCRYINISLSI